MNRTCSPKLLRKLQSLWAASVTSMPNFTAKKGKDCGHMDATSTLCFDVSHFWQQKQRRQCKAGFILSHCVCTTQVACMYLNLVQCQNPLHFLQILLRNLQILLLWQTTFTGQTGTQQQLRFFIYLRWEEKDEKARWRCLMDFNERSLLYTGRSVDPMRCNFFNLPYSVTSPHFEQ